MYNQYFGLAEAPFSIAPDPRYLFLSEQHREALAHLLYGIGDQGGFIVLTGEVGTGKTTVCRCLLQQLPDHADVAFIVNPKLDSRELLQTICEELGVALPEGDLSIKQLIDGLNELLLSTHARGRNAILIIDEAQNLDADVLEQLRLLTNLETSERKLLQLILLGQPELNTLLARPDLRQLAQRITARYHLRPLSRDEVSLYIEHRLAIAGRRGSLFTPAAIQRIYRYSQGIPRLINLLCDRALLGVYAGNGSVVDGGMVRRAAAEVLPQTTGWRQWCTPRNIVQIGAIVAAVLVVAVGLALWLHRPEPTAAMPLPAEGPAAAGGGEAATVQLGWEQTLLDADPDANKLLGAIAARWGAQEAADNAARCGETWSCPRLSGQTRADLERFNVPVILWVDAGAARALPLALLELQRDSALVAFAGREWTLPWSALTQRWHGDLQLPLPVPAAELPLGAGASGPLVGWLDDQLYRHYHQGRPRWLADRIDDSARLGDTAPRAGWLASHYLGLAPAPARAALDAPLLAELKRFQKEAGIVTPAGLDLPTVLALVKARHQAVPQLLAAAGG